MSFMKLFIKKRISFKSKLFLAFALLPTISIIVLSVFFYWQQQSFLYQDSKNKLVQSMESLSRSCVPWVISQDFAGLNEIIDSYRDNIDYNYVFITDKTGKILAHVDKNQVGLFVNDKVSLAVISESKNEEFIEDSLYTMTMVTPIMKQDDIVGWLWCQKNSILLFAELKQIIVNGAIFTVIGLLTGLFFASVLARTFTKGISKLLVVVQQITTGKRDVRLDFSWGDEIGQVATGINHMLDVIELSEQEILRREELFRSIFENSANANVLSNVQGDFQRVNQAFANMVGYTIEELNHLDLIKITHQDDVDDTRKLLMSLFLDEIKICKFEKRYIHSSGAEIWCEVSATIIRDAEEEPLYLSSINDITTKKNYEKNLQRINEELEDRVYERTEDLSRSNKELDDFAYIASHDLKEPLRSISNFSSFILEDYQDKLDGEGVRKLNVLIDQSARLENFLNALLKYSKVGRVTITSEKVDLHSVVAIVKQDLDFLLSSVENASVQILIDTELPIIESDPVFIKEIYMNLISNAVKYNDKPERIISLGYLNEYRDASRVFYVKDNGIGIQEKNLGDIFKIFKRLHGRDKYGGGTGAGLTIVKKLVEALRGNLWVESTPGIGSTFYFTLGG